VFSVVKGFSHPGQITQPSITFTIRIKDIDEDKDIDKDKDKAWMHAFSVRRHVPRLPHFLTGL
jgi:hypothetical protein